MGKYGNSNPHFLSDWIDVENLSKSQMLGNFDAQGECIFPSSAFVRVFYQRIGQTSSPQNTIIKADFEWKNSNKWKFTKPLPQNT